MCDENGLHSVVVWVETNVALATIETLGEMLRATPALELYKWISIAEFDREFNGFEIFILGGSI